MSAPRQVGTALLAIVGLLLATAGLLLALVGEPSMGVVADQPGGIVRSVLAGGLAWSDGIRSGQHVTGLVWEPPSAWELEVVEDGIRSVLAPHAARLREAAVPAVLGLAFGLLLAALVRRRPILAAMGAVVASLAGGIALWATGDAAASTIAAAAAVAVPVTAVVLSWGLGRGASVLAALATAGLLAAWTAVRFAAPDLYPAAEAIRVGWVAGAVAVLGWFVARDLHRGIEPPAEFPRPLDVLVAGVAGLVLLGGVMAFAIPIPVAVALAIGLAVLYPRARAGLVRTVDRFLYAEARARSRLEAIETERGRVAREIHDSPLQVLAGVVRRLERVPGEHETATALREVADDLRRIATDLHPPVLHDLGLAPALRSLVGRAADEGVAVSIEVDDRTGYGSGERPPAPVELAAYRIAAEALANARAHAPGAPVRLHGTIAPDTLELAIDDDGPGLDGRALRRAIGAGHLGVVSMRERADSIGAALEIRSEGGTKIRLRWPRS